MQLSYAPGSVPAVGQFYTPWFAAAEAAQTISPSSLVIATSGTHTFTTNLPAVWTVSSGTIVAAADGFSALFTAPGSAQLLTVTATNENDPGDAAAADVTVVDASRLPDDFIRTANSRGSRSCRMFIRS